jgi:plastocyanin
VPVEATVTWVWLGVEAHEVSASPGAFFPIPADHRGMRRRGPQEVSTASSRLAFRFAPRERLKRAVEPYKSDGEPG